MTFELKSSGVAIVTHANPKSFHPLTSQYRAEIFCVLEHCKRSKDVKVVVWTAQGEKAFCSGAALKGAGEISVPKDILGEYARRGMAPNLSSDSALMNETKAFWDFPKPIIGAINGVAVGGGANIALCNFFDIVICSTNARFKYPFVEIGFTPELSSSLILPLIAGPVRAKQLIYSADWFSPEEALDLKLINKVVSPEELMPTALATAESFASKPTQQMMLSKQLLNAHLRDNLDKALYRENDFILKSVRDYGGKEVLLNRMKEMKSGKKDKAKL
eukprot:CAMPEP_0184542258 /NCGR_PEP_ID=MMETSP0199_2-20130426/1871_1 /TAXON_ID=1112570 /ORGANISM="Thraustochytrium sp., Strain LLF1b" /LENGTH=274 /DNA_ID=CAMNT_0026936029 /DNA_START=136 /DNA_END=960 /DNA_ORIENTATION=+